jgi:hypothetical protein
MKEIFNSTAIRRIRKEKCQATREEIILDKISCRTPWEGLPLYFLSEVTSEPGRESLRKVSVRMYFSEKT